MTRDLQLTAAMEQHLALRLSEAQAALKSTTPLKDRAEA